MTEAKIKFLSKVKKQKNGCWHYGNHNNKNVYTTAYVLDKPMSAHRTAYKLFVGELKTNLCICHHCDNKRCVNPSHLFQGTYSDNMKDASQKGLLKENYKFPNGELHPNSVLTPSLVKQIRKETLSLNKIAKKYGVSKYCVYSVINKITWKNV